MDKIGPYKIVRSIASGGMGEVYMAALERRAGFQKTVALKCMLPELVGKQNLPNYLSGKHVSQHCCRIAISLKSSTSGMKKTGSG